MGALRKVRRAVTAAVAVVAGLAVLTVAAWAVDRARTEGVARNVEVGGIDVGGATTDEVVATVEQVAATVEAADIAIETPHGVIATTAADVGLTVDRAATINAVLDIDDGAVMARPVRWARSFVTPLRAGVQAEVDLSVLEAVLPDLDNTDRREPVEPDLTVVDGELVVDDPEPGRGLSAPLVAAAMEKAARSGRGVITVATEPVQLPTRFSAGDARRLLPAAQDLASRSIVVRSGDQQADVTPSQLREWIGLAPTDDELVVEVDGDRAAGGLADLLPEAGDEPRDARAVVGGEAVRIEEAVPGEACCSPAAGGVLAEALRRGDESVEVPLRTVDPDLSKAEAEQLGIVEPIATFTTRHACCENRVRNIQHLADLLRGTIIEPGETWSLNEAVGRRTAAKGFFEAGVIYRGRFETDIGGGISQFVTTIFNAAFFAGLEFEEYQSHSIYISRYPYGREATISFPKPDFKVRNNLEHGVAIWPTYTSRSITVTLYGTKTITAEQTGQSTRRQGRCTRVTTERTRTWPDGQTETDSVFAVYRPAEGVNC